MESIIRNVSDIEADKRQWLESALGQPLQDNQQVIIQVITIGAEPDAVSRRAALTNAAGIAARGRSSAAAQGVSEEEVDAALEEAVQYVRGRKD